MTSASRSDSSTPSTGSGFTEPAFDRDISEYRAERFVYDAVERSKASASSCNVGPSSRTNRRMLTSLERHVSISASSAYELQLLPDRPSIAAGQERTSRFVALIAPVGGFWLRRQVLP